jgi:uncharacterized oxidoreductase
MLLGLRHPEATGNVAMAEHGNSELVSRGDRLMRMHSNTIFITGGGSGIGRGLAEAFHKLGNQVIITGRRKAALTVVCEANPGMRSFALDVTDPVAVREVAARVSGEFPDMNCVFNNAGVQKGHDFALEEPLNEQAVLEEINTNLLGVIRVASAFVPYLRGKAGATFVNVSSGLAFVPLARFPVYCATKAAVHSLTMSLRQQLRTTGVKVVELIPPYVATDLGRESKVTVPVRPQPMPLGSFIDETMKALAGDADEVAIGDAKKLMAAAAGGDAVRAAFLGMNR